MAVNYSSMSGTSFPAWLRTFQAALGQPLLHGCEISCMAVSFSSISGTAWLWSISGAAYPAWLRAFQACLGQPILHGCELFNHFWESLSCMAVSFSSMSGTTYPRHRLSWAFQACLGQPILHGCELSKHPWERLSCMAVRFMIEKLTAMQDRLPQQQQQQQPAASSQQHQQQPAAAGWKGENIKWYILTVLFKLVPKGTLCRFSPLEYFFYMDDRQGMLSVGLKVHIWCPVAGFLNFLYPWKELCLFG